MAGYALSEVEEAPSYSADQVEEAPTTQQSSAAMDQVTRPQSPAPVAPVSPRLSLGTSPRSTAEGLVTEQQERRGGMPLTIQPANYGLTNNPHPEQIAPVARPTTRLAAPPAVVPALSEEINTRPENAPTTPQEESAQHRQKQADESDTSNMLANYSRTVEAGKRIGTKAGGALGVIASSRIEDLPSEGNPGIFSDEFQQQYAKEHPAAVGVGRATGGLVGQMAADPVTYLFAGSSELASPVLDRIISTGFRLGLGVHAVSAARDLQKNWNNYSPEERYEKATDAGLSGILAAGAKQMRESLKGPYEALPSEPNARAESLFRNLVYKAGGTVPENATLEQANAAFRAAISNLHPDVNPAAAEDARNLNDAWTQLKRSGRFSGADVVADMSKLPRAQLAEYLDRADHDPAKAKAMWMADREAAQTPPEAPLEQALQPATPAVPSTAGVSPQPAVAQTEAVPEFRADEVEEIQSPNETSAGIVSNLPAATGRNLRVSERESAGADQRADRGTDSGATVSPKSSERERVGVAAPGQLGVNEAGVQRSVPAAGTSQPAPRNENAPSSFAKGDSVTLPDGRAGQIKYVSPQGKAPVITVTVDGKTERFVGAKEVRGLKAVADESKPETQGGKTGEVVGEAETPYKFGSTQANIPHDSEASKALASARVRISKSDLMPTGFGGNQTTGLEDHPHVTVRYGIKGDDVEGIRNFLRAQSPFEASLGKMNSFPPSEHSDGAAPIIAPVNAPALHLIEAELDKHGDFNERSFPDYKPHATVAYVKPEAVHKYVGDPTTEGKKFTVSEIAITDRQGNQQVVKLEGKASPRSPAVASAGTSDTSAGSRSDSDVDQRQPREFAAHEVEESPTARLAPDIANWQAPPELGVSHAPDYGQKVRSETEKKMGGPLPRSAAPERTKPERERQTLGLPPEPGRVGEMNTRDLKVAPNKFQYKLSTDAEGVGTLLKETKVFNPDLAGVISVWRDPADGKTYVVNGHHRYELAKRLGVKTVTVRHVVAPTAKAARAIGAEQNIADGRGSAVDAAKFFRDSGITPTDLQEKGISLGEATVAKGVALANLSEPIFNRVVQGDLTQGRAIAIGEATGDAAEQKAVLDLVERKERSGTKVSDDTLSELIRLVKGSEQTTETTADLFGTQQINRSLALEKAEISAHIKQQLGKDKKLFGFVSKGDRATELERGGNKIDVEKSKQISTGAAQAEEVYNLLSARGGPIANILDESARQLADGDNAASVKAEAYSRIRAEVSKTLGGGERSSAERHGGTPEADPLFSPDPGPIDPVSAREIKFELKPTREDLPPYLLLNPDAVGAINRVLGVRLNGVNIDAGMVPEITTKLKAEADRLEDSHGVAAVRIRALANALIDNADPVYGVSVIKQNEDVASQLATLHEEMTHAMQRAAGGGNLQEGVPWREVIKEPGMAEMAANRIVPQLIRNGIAPHPSVIAAEGLVDIMRGDAQEITADQAEQTALKYFEAMADAHGIESVERIRDVESYISTEAAKLGVTYGQQDIREAGQRALARVLSRSTGKALQRAGKGKATAKTETTRSGAGAGLPERDAGKKLGGPGSKNEGGTLASTQPIGLTDEELADWSKSRGFRVEPAGEQLDIFGGNDPVMRVFRAGRGGKEQKALVYQSQIEQLSQPKAEPTEPFTLTGGESRDHQPTLFGAGDLGEIVGNPKAANGIQLPSQQRDRGTSLFNKDRESLLTGESGSLNPSLRAAKSVYAKFINGIIDKNLDLGDKYQRVAEHDPAIATMLKEKDNAPRYFHAKAESNIEQKVTKGLNESQVRLAAMMSDNEIREYLEESHPDQFQEAQDDPIVMAAVQAFKPFRDELAQVRIALGWHVRRDLSTLENEDGDWTVIDRDGNEVENFGRSQKDAQEYAEEVGQVLDHLKRTYPEHKRDPLMGMTSEGPSLGASYGGIKAPRPDKKQRIATAQYFYEHGAKDFSGYIKSFTQAYHAALNQKIYDSLTDEATKWREGTAQPPQIEYRGKTYYSPDVAKSMKLAKPENRPKQILEYRAYDPAKDDKVMIRDFENGWSTTTTGRPGISPSDRYLAPKEVVDALEHYDMTRGVKENDSIRRFFQDQIVGLFGPNIHVLNIMRRLATTVGAGAWDPRVWPYYQKLFFSKELRDRMAAGLADDAVDALSKWGTYTNTRDIGSLHEYALGNMDPRNWVKWTIGTFSKGVLFDPKFMGGFGGLDQKARVIAYDFLKDHGMGEEEASKNVEDGFGNYNKANWTERMKRWARALLFPGWDFSSLKWFLRHPIKTAFLPALVTMGANLALNKAGKNRDSDKYDFSYLHYGDRKFRTNLVTESMALHLVEPALEAGKAALEGGDARDIAGAAGQGVLRGGGGLAGNLRPEIQAAAELLSNRQYMGGEKEIWKPEDRNIPGKVLPTRMLDKMLAFSVVKSLPAVNRFLDASYDSVDVATGAGSVIGVTNYKSGAEERLKTNEAKAMDYSQTLSTLAAKEPESAEKFVQDPVKAPYLLFNKDFSELAGDLKKLDTEIERVKIAEMQYTDRKRALEDLRTSRTQLLQSADALDEELTNAKLQMKKAVGQ